MNEIWKPVKHYEKLYAVSNLGRVKRLGGTPYCPKDRLLKPRVTKDGYLQVRLSMHSNAYNYYVHRLVAEAFLPNPNHYPAVNHINEVKTCNEVNNLEWCSVKENNCWGTRTQRGVATKRRKGIWG